MGIKPGIGTAMGIGGHLMQIRLALGHCRLSDVGGRILPSSCHLPSLFEALVAASPAFTASSCTWLTLP